MTPLDQMEEIEVEAPVDDFAELDKLLAGAIKAADARKAARQLAQKPKSLLTPEEQESIAHAQELLTWDDESSVARFVEVHCACGASHQTFDGWFIVSSHRRDASARRFRRSSWHEDLPAWRYVVLEEVEGCVECLAVCGLPTANTADFPGIEALGNCPECDGLAQLVLDLDPTAGQQVGDLLAELEEEAEWLEEVEAEEAAEDEVLILSGDMVEVEWQIGGRP